MLQKCVMEFLRAVQTTFVCQQEQNVDHRLEFVTMEKWYLFEFFFFGVIIVSKRILLSVMEVQLFVQPINLLLQALFVVPLLTFVIRPNIVLDRLLNVRQIKLNQMEQFVAQLQVNQKKKKYFYIYLMILLIWVLSVLFF